MKIIFRKHDNVQDENFRWEADRPSLPGAPVVGRGKTWKEALGDLFYQDQSSLGYEIEAPKNEE